ncbi:hypothetical protein C2E23DRAFT_862537 [Lenzites betulinus]|nr:hypothetical protein C2E23DRAFT_862537 [Lenzites betulinus]
MFPISTRVFFLEGGKSVTGIVQGVENIEGLLFVIIELDDRPPEFIKIPSPTGVQQEPDGSPTGARRESNRSPTGVQQEPDGSPTGARREPDGSPTGARRESNGSPTGVHWAIGNV